MPKPKESTGRQQWNSPLEDYNFISKEACKFLFEQAKLYFEETIEESEELTERAIRILFLLLPAVAAVVAFCFVNQAKLKPLHGWGFLLYQLQPQVLSSAFLICSS